jgi:hypothetical protein
VISDDARRQGGVEAEIGADVEDNRSLGEKRTENAYDIGLMLPPEDIGERIERAHVDTDVFPGTQAHERPVTAYREWTHSRAVTNYADFLAQTA